MNAAFPYHGSLSVDDPVPHLELFASPFSASLPRSNQSQKKETKSEIVYVSASYPCRVGRPFSFDCYACLYGVAHRERAIVGEVVERVAKC